MSTTPGAGKKVLTIVRNMIVYGPMRGKRSLAGPLFMQNTIKGGRP